MPEKRLKLLKLKASKVSVQTWERLWFLILTCSILYYKAVSFEFKAKIKFSTGGRVEHINMHFVQGQYNIGLTNFGVVK